MQPKEFDSVVKPLMVKRWAYSRKWAADAEEYRLNYALLRDLDVEDLKYAVQKWLLNSEECPSVHQLREIALEDAVGIPEWICWQTIVSFRGFFDLPGEDKKAFETLQQPLREMLKSPEVYKTITREKFARVYREYSVFRKKERINSLRADNRLGEQFRLGGETV